MCTAIRGGHQKCDQRIRFLVNFNPSFNMIRMIYSFCECKCIWILAGNDIVKNKKGIWRSIKKNKRGNCWRIHLRLYEIAHIDGGPCSRPSGNKSEGWKTIKTREGVALQRERHCRCLYLIVKAAMKPICLIASTIHGKDERLHLSKTMAGIVKWQVENDDTYTPLTSTTGSFRRTWK